MLDPQVMCALLMELNNVAANPLRNALSSRTAPGPTKLVAAIPVDGRSNMSVCERQSEQTEQHVLAHTVGVECITPERFFTCCMHSGVRL
jgi:hypothetical protein